MKSTRAAPGSMALRVGEHFTWMSLGEQAGIQETRSSSTAAQPGTSRHLLAWTNRWRRHSQGGQCVAQQAAQGGHRFIVIFGQVCRMLQPPALPLALPPCEAHRRPACQQQAGDQAAQQEGEDACGAAQAADGRFQRAQPGGHLAVHVCGGRVVLGERVQQMRGVGGQLLPAIRQELEPWKTCGSWSGGSSWRRQGQQTWGCVIAFQPTLRTSAGRAPAAGRSEREQKGRGVSSEPLWVSWVS